MAHEWEIRDYDLRTYCKNCGVRQSSLYAGTNCPALAPATPEPPEWKDEAQKIFNRYMSARIAHAAARKSDIEEFFEGSQWAVHLESYPAQNEAVARAMSAPLPHDPPISARLMPWRQKEVEP